MAISFTTEELRKIFFARMVQGNEHLGSISYDHMPEFGSILRGLIGFKHVIQTPERAYDPGDDRFWSRFDVKTGIMTYTGVDGLEKRVDILDRDYLVVDSWGQDPVYNGLNQHYIESNQKHKGFYDFFKKEACYHCSLFDIFAGRAREKERVMMPNIIDREKIRLMEEVLTEYTGLLKTGGLTKGAYRLMEEKIKAGTIYQDIHSEITSLYEHLRAFPPFHDGKSNKYWIF